MNNPQIIVHLPLPFFNSDQLIRTIYSAHDSYSKLGIGCYHPNTYRSILSSSFPEKNASSTEMYINQDGRLVDEINWPNEIDRTIISLPLLLCPRLGAVGHHGLFPEAERRLKEVHALFPDHEILFFVGVVDPALLVSALAQADAIQLSEICKKLPRHGLSWHDVIGACIDELPNARFVIWRHEDASFLWPRILRAVCQGNQIELPPGSLDMIAKHIPESEMKKLIGYIRRASRKDDEFTFLLLREFFQRFSSSVAKMREKFLSDWALSNSDYFTQGYQEDMRLLESEERVALIR